MPSAIASHPTGHACMNTAIEAHNQKVLNGAAHGNGVAKPSSDSEVRLS